MSVQLVGGMADTSRRARWKRARRVIIPVAAALGSVSAFLAWLGRRGLSRGGCAERGLKLSFFDNIEKR